MGHVEEMADRLPLLYRDAKLIRGSREEGGVLEPPALQLEILDEDALGVQLSHWFDAVLELDEAADLAAVLDIAPEPWQRLGDFRAWVHSIRDAMLQEGAVTKRALQEFVQHFLDRYRAATGITATPSITTWSDRPSTSEPAFVENPPRRRYDRAPVSGGIEPLHQFSLIQRGLDEAFAGFLLVGLPSAPESVPVVANLTSGQALIFLGNVPPGARLWISPTQDGGVEASLEGTDVSDKMHSVSLQPGIPWSNLQVRHPAEALVLRRGRNDLWFLPVAHFDVLGLDRFLLSLADLVLEQGRYNEMEFDHALFYQDPAVLFHITWVETQPASFEIHLPAGTLLSSPGELEESLDERNRLGFSLNEAVQKLKVAGVEANVKMLAFAEVQGQMDRMTSVLPLVHSEVGPTGADRLSDAAGLFEVTDFNHSTFR